MSGTADGEIRLMLSSMRFFNLEKEDKMLSKLSEIKKQFETRLLEVKDSGELEELRVSLFGKNGTMKSVLKEMGALSVEEKKAIGAKVNELKAEIFEKIGAKKNFNKWKWRDRLMLFKQLICRFRQKICRVHIIQLH